MSIYECLECGEVFQDITHLHIHLTSKAGCEKNNKKQFDCIKCKKRYTTNWSKQRHMQKCYKKDDLENIKNKFDKLENELKKTKEELEKTKEESTKKILEFNDQIQQLQSQIKRKPGRPKKIVNNISNCHNTNTTNTTNNITNKTKNIYQLNYINFGDEDLSKLTNKEKSRIGSSSYSSINLLTELVHCNPRLPEQQNIYINNSKLEKCHIIKDGKLELNDLDERLDDIIINRSGDLIEILKDEDVSIEDIHRERCSDLLNKIKHGDEKQIQKIKNELKFLIYNKNKMNENIKQLNKEKIQYQ